MDEPSTPIDIANCYRLAHGREPESSAVVEEKLGHPRAGLLAEFFGSGEFKDKVRKPAAASAALRGGIFQPPPSPDLLAWTVAFTPLTNTGRDQVCASVSWYELYLALFSDPMFQNAVLNDQDRADNPAFLAALDVRVRVEGLADIKGRVELVTSTEIRGWALDGRAPDRRLALQLLVDGAVVAAALTEIYRPEVQAELGGQGRVGFVFRRPSMNTKAGPAEVREAASGVTIESFHLDGSREAPMDAALAIRKELAELRSLLERIEARLPDFNEAFSYALENYDAYFERYYAAAPASGTVGVPAPALPLTVFVDATDTTPSALDGALTSLQTQQRRPSEIVVVYPAGPLELEYDEVLKTSRERAGQGSILQGVVLGAAGWKDALSAAQAPQLLIIQARIRLAPDALQSVSAALADGAAFVFADSDEITPTPDGAGIRHGRPSFRTAFDYDLVLQAFDLGEMLGLQRSVVTTLGVEDRYGPARWLDLILRHVEAHGDAGVVHLQRVLSHSVGRAPVEPEAMARRAEVVVDHLARTNVDAQVVSHDDELGAKVEGALRVRRRPPAATRAAVIIPTRDRLDLLGPCLDSLVASASNNQAEMEIVVVDNASAAPTTRTFLESFGRVAPLRVVEHDGGFNWALINNRAAQTTDAEVLIFLNNDTLVLTPDWCDELCSQALRPEVGAVGARLLYEDGTIQHAGVVMGGLHAFAAHEGMGAPGSDPGHLGRHVLLRQTAAVTGACLATSASAFHALGGFDALNLPVESNDTDYCLRARERGLRILYDPYCTLFHFESKSRGLNHDPQKRRAADETAAFMRTRWSKTCREDPFFNLHFDRLGAPLQRLTAPPAQRRQGSR